MGHEERIASQATAPLARGDHRILGGDGTDALFSQLAGERYEAVAEIGSGAFGRVLEARDLSLDRRVAIKLIRHGGNQSRAATDLFREARTASAAGSSAVTIYDVLSGADGVGIVMELIRGGSLIQAARPGTSIARGWELAIAVTTSVARVHDRGIVHLDLHPGNALVRDDRSVALADFGLARFAKSARLSRGGHERNWTAPELLGYGVASTRADVFALGLILGWIARRTGIALGTVVARSTNEDPRLRPEVAAEVLQELRELPPPIWVAGS